MRIRLLFIALLLFFAPMLSRAAEETTAASAAAATAPANRTLVIHGPGEGIAELGGEWEFHTGDNMAWASPAFDDSGWEKIGVDRSWGEQGHFAYRGFAWYRRHIDFVPVAGGAPKMALLMPLVENAYEVYWNGAWMGHYGELPPHPVGYRGLPQTFSLGRPRSGVLAIRVWAMPALTVSGGERGGIDGAPLAGSPEAIAATEASANYDWLRRMQFNFGLVLLSAALALLGLLAWLRDRRQRLVLWTALYLLVMALDVGLLDALRLPPALGLDDLLAVTMYSLERASLWFLLLYLFQLEDHAVLCRWVRIAALVSIVSASLQGLAAFSYSWWAGHVLTIQIADAVFTVPRVVLSLIAPVAIVLTAGKRMRPASRMVAVIVLLSTALSAVADTAAQGRRFTHWTLGMTLNTPLFTIDGNSFPAQKLLYTLLLLSIVYAVYRYLVEQSERQSTLEQEFKSAQELQRILIPETLPPLPGFAVTSAYRPAQEVGGDFFQLITQADGSALLALGDVSGKGLKAAMTVSLLVGTIRTLAETSSNPADILAGLNRRLEGRLQNGFVTCLILRLDAGGECAIANAGHLPPFLNEEEVSLPAALPLGIVPDIEFATTLTQVGVGDRLTLYTDGLVEARNASGELYGFDRVRDLIATHPDAQTASEAAVAFGQDDDITVLTITRLAVGVESTTSLLAPELVLATA